MNVNVHNPVPGHSRAWERHIGQSGGHLVLREPTSYAAVELFFESVDGVECVAQALTDLAEQMRQKEKVA